MECKDILNLIAIVVIPIAAVLIGQYLQNRAEIRKDKMQIFKTLMTSRIYGWTQESVHCLNIIDIVFADDKTVRDAWKDLYDKYCVQNPDAAQLKKSKMHSTNCWKLYQNLLDIKIRLLGKQFKTHMIQTE